MKVGVENMMREGSKHRWRIEYCDTGKQEPDEYGTPNARNVGNAEDKPLPDANPTGSMAY